MTKLKGLTTAVNQLPELCIKTPFLVKLTKYQTGVGRGRGVLLVGNQGNE